MKALARLGLLIAMATGVACVEPMPAQQALPVADQVAIYTAVLQVEAAFVGRGDQRLPFLLVPIPVRPGPDTDRIRPADWARLSLDSAVVNALLRARVVDGLCWPLSVRRCAGDYRGYGARVSVIEAFDTVAVVSVEVRIVLGERDNAVVPDHVVGHAWELTRRDGRWTITTPWRSSRP